MKKYVSKRVEIEAVQFTATADQVGQFYVIDAPAAYPILREPDGPPFIQIVTRSGDQRCNSGDYIIREIDGSGSYYPCGQAIFEMKYEEAL